MSDPSDPQWDLLPDQPEPFFGLSGEYDVRDLKRSYNALIRKFKPEKFPEEFQKIRAAYERLDDALRYGETSQTSPGTSDLQFNWAELLQEQLEPEPTTVPLQPPTDANADHEDAEPVFLSDEQPLHERVRTERLQDLYQELKTLPVKTPYEYYALAFLSDFLDSHSQSFPMWLLKGLKAHPDDTLAACEENLLDYRVDHLLVFYIHILKAALWKADRVWLASTFSLIETNLRRLPPWLEYEFHFLELIRVYQRERELFLTGGPLRATIDQTIQDYCTQSEQQADQSFLECQQLLVSQRNELLEEFDLTRTECETIQMLWEKIAEDVFERINTGFHESLPETLEQRTKQLVAQLSEEDSGADYRRSVKIPRLGFLLFLAVSVMISLLGLVFKGDAINGPFLILGCLLLLNGVVFVISSIISEHVIRAFYLSWWRQNLMQFYQSDWVPLVALALQLKQLKQKQFKKNKAYNLDEVAIFMLHDVSLYFYTTAQRLLTACE